MWSATENRPATGEQTTTARDGLVKSLRTLPDAPERSRHELTLQLTLGPALQSVKGYGSPEVERLYTRSRELCLQRGEFAQSAWILLGLWGFYCTRAEYQKARDITEEILHLAQSVQDPAVQAAAHWMQVGDGFLSGEIVAAREHCEQLITLYDLQQHRASARHGVDFGVSSRSVAAQALWLLGYPAQALQRAGDTRVPSC